MQYQFRPIHEWPGTKTKNRKRSTFHAAWSRTLVDLDRELQHLGAKNLVIQAAVTEDEIRLDGMMRSNARPSWPGVILSFDSKIGPLSYPCDTFTDWQANVRAIALALAALRAVNRYGVTRHSEQYKGWARLEAPQAAPSHDQKREAAYTLLSFCDIVFTVGEVMDSPSVRDNVYRRAVFRVHPDHGGDTESFRKVQEAKTVLDKH